MHICNYRVRGEIYIEIIQLLYISVICSVYFQIAPVESVNELVAQISASPAKTYLLEVTCIGVIFLIGITCGRVIKRVSKV